MTNGSDNRLIFTDHARKRLLDRKITEHDARAVFNAPDRTNSGKSDSVEYRKKIGNIHFTLVVIHKKDGWIVVSIWRDPPAYGTSDERHNMLYTAYQKASFWGKVWILVREQFDF